MSQTAERHFRHGCAHVVAHVGFPPVRAVAIGGGTGLPMVLRGLRMAAGSSRGAALQDHSRSAGLQACHDWPTAIVTVMDDGGSSGRLRQSLGVLPPGDIRNCLAALVQTPSSLSSILNERLAPENGQAGHPIGSLLLAAMSTTEGNLLNAVARLGSQLGIVGRVLPATLESVHLTAAFEDGSDVRGESAITARGGRIRRLALERPVRPVPETIEALVNANLIVVGPGSLYTSILPNLLVDGVAATISGVRATRVYVANLMTEPGETDGYSLADHLRVIREHSGFDLFDYVLVNRAALPADAVAHYAADGAHTIDPVSDVAGAGRAHIIEADLATVTSEGQIRHDPAALGSTLTALCNCR
ncbi:MAG: gluconeogenesis factor YvcK family protein [Vicinamibacterales bacterium]